MKRHAILAVLAALVVGTVAAEAQDAITIKRKVRGDGESILIKRQATDGGGVGQRKVRHGAVSNQLSSAAVKMKQMGGCGHNDRKALCFGRAYIRLHTPESPRRAQSKETS